MVPSGTTGYSIEVFEVEHFEKMYHTFALFLSSLSYLPPIETLENDSSRGFVVFCCGRGRWS